MRKKILTAGPLVAEVIYTPKNVHRDDRQRAAKTMASTEAQRCYNHKRSWQKLELYLAANLGKGDIVGCLTFNDEQLPATRKQVARRVGVFRDKLRKVRAARGQELVMFWSIEHRHGEGRWHIHFACNATGRNDYKEIFILWGRGGVELHPLRVDKDKNYGSLAQYMSKEAREKVGQQAWSCTKNINKYEEDSLDVPDNSHLQIPDNAIVFADRHDRNEFGRYEYVKYVRTNAARTVKRRKE